MPFINGQWIDEEQARMMAMRGANPMIYGGTFDTPMIYEGTTDVPDPMLYGGTTDVPGSMAFQGEGMLSPTLPNPLQAFTEPAFTQPLAALNRQATGSFQGEGGTMDPAAINAAMGPQLAGPTVNQFRPTGSDYTPQQLSTPIDQLQQQNIPSNVVPIDPTAGLAASDPNLQGVTPFSQASSLNPFAAQASIAPQTSSLQAFSLPGRTPQARVSVGEQPVSPVTDQDYIDQGTIPQSTPIGSNINQSNAFLADEYRASTPSMIGLGTGWDQTDASGIFGTPTYVGSTTTDNQGDVMPDLTGNIDIPAAIDLGWRMTGYKPGLRNSGNITPMPTSPSGDQTMYTDEGETDITDLMDKHFEDPNATKDVALAIAQNYQDNPQTELWNDSIAKSLGLSKHDVEVANSLLGHVDSSDPNTTVTVAPGAGYAPAVTISEESTFQPGVVPTHTLGNKYLDEVVAAITKPTQTTTNWVDKPTPTKTAYTGPTKAELRAAAVAQRKADAKARKAAARRTAAAQKHLEDSRAAAARAQAASAAQAQAAQNAARAVLASAAGRDRGGPSSREIAAAIEVLSGVDSFGSGGMRNTRGEVGMDETGYTDLDGLGVG